MDLFEELDKERLFFTTKNKSTGGLFYKPKISINDIDYFSKTVRISSPRSLIAMNKLGINDKDLEFLTFKEYMHKNPELIGESKEIQKIKYDHVEEIRKRRFEQIKQLRSEIPENEILSLKQRCFSSKLRGQNPLSQKKNIYSHSFLEKDIRSFNRMRNINKTELFNKMQIELRKELIKIINEEKEKKENEDNIKYRRILNKKLKIQNKKKLKEEEQKIREEKEKAKLERKKEEIRIQNLINKSIQDEKLLKQKLKLERERRDEDERKHNEFKEKMNKQREANYLYLLQRENEMEERANLYKKELENEKNELRKSKEKKLREKREKVEKNLKRMEYEQELKRIIYEENERNKNEKKRMEEKRYKMEMKRSKNKYNEKDKIRNELIQQHMIFDYDEKQKYLTPKPNHNNYVLKIKNKEKQEELGEKELKQKIILFKNELILNRRKEDIMSKINEKEKSIQKTREEKKKKNLLAQEVHFQKKLNKEYRLKKIAQLLENRRKEIRQQLNEKDKRVEEFMQNKNNNVLKKKNMYDEISKEKQFINEQLEKILNKKTIDKSVLNSLKEMFPDNKQIDDIINAFNVHLDKIDKNKINNYDYEN